MQYTQDDFLRLMTEIDDQGGSHLDEVCDTRYFTHGGDKIKGTEIAYCGQSALFEIPYVGFDKHGNELAVQPIKVCAVDDAVGRWPRFAECIQDEESG